MDNLQHRLFQKYSLSTPVVAREYTLPDGTKRWINTDGSITEGGLIGLELSVDTGLVGGIDSENVLVHFDPQLDTIADAVIAKSYHLNT